MEKLDEESAQKFISALIKSVQTLCHGYLNFQDGVEIIGHINLSVDRGSRQHYILEEKVCKNEENSTLFISNSFHAENKKHDAKLKGKDSQNVPSGNQVVQRHDSSDNEGGTVSSAISSIATALTGSNGKVRTGSDAKDLDSSHSKPNTAKRKASDDNDVRPAKSSHLSSSPSPVSHFLSNSPRNQSGASSPTDAKPCVSRLHSESGAEGDGGEGDLNLAGSVLERVDDHSNSDLPDQGDDSDGDLEVTFIKEEFVEGEQSSCQYENAGGQFGSRARQRGSSESMSDPSLYPVSLHHSAPATFVPSAHDMSSQHYGPSTSSSQPGTSGSRGMRSQQGATQQLRHHASHTLDAYNLVAPLAISFTPPVAHNARPPSLDDSPALSVLDLSIKAEPADPDLLMFNCEPRRRKNYVHTQPPVFDDARVRAKEKSKQYRQKQKIHRMTDQSYDMVFRHQVAERKRRQRMREKINKLKVYGTSGVFNVNVTK